MASDLERAIRVLVVDDSAFMRKVISDILNSDNAIRVIDTAKNGLDAVEKAKELKPDVITLDVEMPVMDGLTCLRELLKEINVPVLMLSGFTREGADYTIKALEDGAVDFITKPTNIFEMANDIKKLEVIEKVKIAHKSTRVKRNSINNLHIKPKNDIVKSREIKKIVAIGTSTGGPKALHDVIPLISGNVPAAFLVVQHMPPGFTRSLAERLNSISELTVKEAEEGDVIKPGFVYIAPGDYHMLVEKTKAGELKIRLSKSPPEGGHRPAVNVMMESLSDTGLTNIIGVIMTGMGSDGSEGIKKLKNINKGYIIAQDEKSCVVYGMPKVAVQTGAVDAVVTLKGIAREIMKIVEVHK
ncbi:two-component system chemotaxis response regulator CheB [Anaerobacterium chartisolvens]|uniref:Protein-glutamate methylesterase/protein-glutamine glutaminase n=1 Tax=Anaerobacterium chartisolvens TaxID=1297424 RepID=A0A369B778_9FIRM|nr:chemotaxis response regulator protein-glutamate methylesterase [Anaerobacterium chartisolvens]RCX15534.1 two-component system chemotaxis response regulator CheB [Anaerobacterium chartisolvens]